MNKIIVATLLLIISIFLLVDVEAKIYDTPVIGIDLGTTYSVVGIYRGGKVEIIPNELGARTTPSVISFDKVGKQLVGQAAKNNAPTNPKNTLYDVKRLIGRRYSEILKKDAKLLTYKIVNKGGRAYVKSEVNGERRVQAPEEVSAKVLKYLKETAEKYLGEEVKYAVITVPAYFNDQQRTATEDAGKIAGLNVLRIVNEPTAAAMTYGLHQQGEQNILVFDLGGGTFDVSLLTIENNIFETLATSGDTRLGGEDFDQRVVDYFIAKFKKDQGVDIRSDPRAFQKLKQACEHAKRTLSTEFEARIEIDNLMQGKDFSEKLTRAKFEQLNMALFKKTMIPVQNVLKDANLKKSDIDHVVLVGGSTRIPKVREMLRKFFNNKELNLSVNPDEAIAHGACIQAAILDRLIEEAALIDVTPLSLGIETQGGKMSVIIPRNTQIPTVKAEIYTTTADYQDRLVIPIYEGERPLTRGNRLLGEMELTNIQQAPRGVPQIKVSFSLDQSGILKISAVDEVTKKTNEVTIKKGSLSEDELKKILEDAKQHEREDKVLVDRENAMQRLTTLTDSINRRMADKSVALRLKSKDKKVVLDALRKTLRFIRKNPDAKKAAIVSQTKELRRVVKKYLYDNEHVAVSEDEIWDDEDIDEMGDVEDEDDQPIDIDDDDQPISEDNDDDQPISDDVTVEDEKKHADL